MKKIILALLFLAVWPAVKGQNKSVSIGTLTPNNSAVLHLESPNQGFLMTRLDSSQINSIVGPATGLIVYNSQDGCYWYKKSYGWRRLCQTDSLVSTSITTTVINGDTANFNYATVNILNTDTIFNNYLTSNYINVDSLIAQYISTNYLNADTIFNTYLNSQHIDVDSLIAQYINTNFLNADTIYNTYLNSQHIDADTIIANYSNINILNTDTIYNNYLTSNNIITNLFTADSANINYLNVNILNTDTIYNTYLNSQNIYTDTLTTNYGNINILNTDTIYNNYLTSNNIITNLFTADSANINYLNADTMIANYGNVNILNTDTIYNNYLQSQHIDVDTIIGGYGNFDTLAIGGNSVLNIISDSLAQAWKINGNGNTTAANFMGTTTANPVILKTNSIEAVRILPPVGVTPGLVGISTNAPTQALDVNGQIRLRTGATNTYILQSNATGVGTWVNPTSILTTTNLNNSAWTILGNSGTSALTNFIGTTDNINFVIKTNSAINYTVQARTGSLVHTIKLPFYPRLDTLFPAYRFNSNAIDGIGSNNDAHMYVAYDNKYLHSGDLSYNVFSQVGNMAPVNSERMAERFVTTVGSSIVGNKSYIRNGNQAYIIGASDSINGPIGNSGSQDYIFGAGNRINANLSVNVNGSTIIGQFNITTNARQVNILGQSNRVNATGLNKTSQTLVGNTILATFDNASVFGCAFNNALDASFATSGTTIIGVGGTRVYSNAAYTAGVTLAPGGGAWAAVSDRKAKENINKIDYQDILKKVVNIDVTEWNYLSQPVDTMNKYAPEGIHYDKAPVHIGPMAQDFSASFGYGEYTDKITSSDIDGVMFAAIKALAEKQEAYEQLKADNIQMKKELEELKALILEIKNK